MRARLALPPRYNEKAQRVQFYEQLLQRLAALPGVASVGATSHLPLTNYNLGGELLVEGRVYQEGEQPPSAPIAAVNTDYFRTMGVKLLAGRLFNEGDTSNAPAVTVLSETLARKLFPNEDPLGKRLLNLGGSGAEFTTVVGVVSDIRHQGLDKELEQAVYLDYRQLPRPLSLLLRSTIDPQSLAPTLRDAVRELDPALPVYDVLTMNERLSNSVAARRFNLLLLGVFAALALVLASVGRYGVISYAVSQRTREIGVRMALGAQPRDILKLIVGQGLSLTFAGVAMGLIASFALTRWLESLLFGVTTTDPLTFASVASLLTLVALLACYLPARRATKVNPLIALRHE